MELQIKQATRFLKGIFAGFWLLPVLLVAAGEWGGSWTGCLADDVQAVYLTETSVILLALLCVPVSLRLFARVLSRRLAEETLPVALRMYVRWSVARLLLLALPLLSGLLSYYLMMSHTGALCALIALTASLFCLPSEERLRRELQIDKTM